MLVKNHGRYSDNRAWFHGEKSKFESFEGIEGFCEFGTETRELSGIKTLKRCPYPGKATAAATTSVIKAFGKSAGSAGDFRNQRWLKSAHVHILWTIAAW